MYMYLKCNLYYILSIDTKYFTNIYYNDGTQRGYNKQSPTNLSHKFIRHIQIDLPPTSTN